MILKKYNWKPLKKEGMEEETRKNLLKYFRKDIEKLTGKDLSEWKRQKLTNYFPHSKAPYKSTN